ncbi:DUF4221 family protein [Thermoflexibacter ruber]|uniref:DUF4221 family protein n=1 Tax=Thermoflexibacter ruber TaxID=1003 RepID=UPI001C867941|nr:DUF4221 family protein [Thermoflexibacter ruber]
MSSLYLSCSTSDSQNKTLENLPILNISNQILTFEIDSNVINRTKFLYTYTDENGKEYLAYANVTNKRNEILVFSLDSKELVKIIPIDIEGPNGVGFIRGFYIKDWNTIYVTSHSTLYIAIINQYGEIKRKIDYSRTKDNQNTSPAIVDYHNPILFDRHKILLPILPDGNWTYMTQEDLNKKYICLQVDTIKKEAAYLSFTLPKDYWLEGKKDPIFSRIKAKDKFVYSFLGDNYLYVTQDHNKFDKYFAGSQFFEKMKPYPKNKGDVIDYMKYMCENSYYDYLIYDEYREVFYRFVNLGIEVTSKANLEKLVSYPPLASIIIIDKNFKKIGELKLPQNKFLISNAFVAKEGLYISNNHPENPEMQDDKLSFTLFKFRN